MKPRIARLIAGADIVPRLAPSNGARDGRPIPDDILGAEIVRFGTIDGDLLPSWMSQVETVGLVIDYRPASSSVLRRAIFGFSELGMWIEHQCHL
jgi:hypothetical protein